MCCILGKKGVMVYILGGWGPLTHFTVAFHDLFMLGGIDCARRSWREEDLFGLSPSNSVDGGRRGTSGPIVTSSSDVSS